MSNISQFRVRDIGTVVAPRTVAEVVDLVNHARAARRAIYPLSTGMNWGFGSREPVRDVDLLVDLGHLDAVRRIDTHHGFAIIEPGVTQAQLARALIGTDFMVNLTASSAHTSVLGNALDRGVGLHRQRDADLVGVEVVTGAGQLARIGYQPDVAHRSHGYVHGIGPNALGLFAQSNFGVVTAGTIRLIRRQPCVRVLRLLFNHRELDATIPMFRDWQDEGLLTGVVKIYDSSAALAYGAGGSPADHAAYICVAGDHDFVNAKERLIRKRSAGWLNQWDTLHADSPLSPCESMLVYAYAGDPSRNDGQLHAAFGAGAHAIDEQDRWGWLFFCSMIPATGVAVRRASAIIAVARPPKNALIGCTVNLLPSGATDLVTSIKIDLRTDGPDCAHRFLDRLHTTFIAEGFDPYRLDVEHMAAAAAIRADEGQEAVLRAIANCLDPAGIVAPERYVDKPSSPYGPAQREVLPR